MKILISSLLIIIAAILSNCAVKKNIVKTKQEDIGVDFDVSILNVDPRFPTSIGFMFYNSRPDSLYFSNPNCLENISFYIVSKAGDTIPEKVNLDLKSACNGGPIIIAPKTMYAETKTYILDSLYKLQKGTEYTLTARYQGTIKSDSTLKTRDFYLVSAPFVFIY